jgi:hypothetical protein
MLRARKKRRLPAINFVLRFPGNLPAILLYTGEKTNQRNRMTCKQVRLMENKIACGNSARSITIFNTCKHNNQRIKCSEVFKKGFIIEIYSKTSVAEKTGTKNLMYRILKSSDRYSLNELVQRLPDNFIRVYKSFIVNNEMIKEVYRHFNGRFAITMGNRGGSRLISGSTYYETLKREFGL